MVQQNTVQEARGPRVVVAIDFGTTFTSVSWAFQTTKTSTAQLIKSWPSSINDANAMESAVVVPSEITYLPPTHEVIKAWGLQISCEMSCCGWFKLGLNKDDQESIFAEDYMQPGSVQQGPEIPKYVSSLVTDYLRCVRLHVRQHIRHLYAPTSISPDFVLAVPAAWGNVACVELQKCAEQAGLGANLQLVTEPHAAALRVFDAEKLDLTPGGTFIVCDAGGGTVDVISFEVSSNMPLMIKTLWNSQGICRGSVHLNRNFAKFLTDKISEGPGWTESARDAAMEFFETVAKRSFTGHEPRDIEIPVPGMANDNYRRIKNGMLLMTDADMRSIFDPVTSKVKELLLDQYRKTRPSPNAVFLVGGFAESPYLTTEIRRAMPIDTVTYRPTNAWCAVATGALLHGLDNPQSGAEF